MRGARGYDAYHCFCEMLSVDIYIDGVEVRAGAPVKRNFIHDLPVCTRHPQLQVHEFDRRRTFTLGIDGSTARVLERTRETHSVQDGDAPCECAVDRFRVIINVFQECV